jgi:hypothetical protein
MCRLWRSGDGATRYGRWGSDQERRRVAGSVRDYKVGPYLGTGPTLITDAKKKLNTYTKGI